MQTYDSTTTDILQSLTLKKFSGKPDEDVNVMLRELHQYARERDLTPSQTARVLLARITGPAYSLLHRAGPLQEVKDAIEAHAAYEDELRSLGFSSGKLPSNLTTIDPPGTTAPPASSSSGRASGESKRHSDDTSNSKTDPREADANRRSHRSRQQHEHARAHGKQTVQSDEPDADYRDDYDDHDDDADGDGRTAHGDDTSGNKRADDDGYNPDTNDDDDDDFEKPLSRSYSYKGKRPVSALGRSRSSPGGKGKHTKGHKTRKRTDKAIKDTTDTRLAETKKKKVQLEVPTHEKTTKQTKILATRKFAENQSEPRYYSQTQVSTIDLVTDEDANDDTDAGFYSSADGNYVPSSDNESTTTDSDFSKASDDEIPDVEIAQMPLQEILSNYRATTKALQDAESKLAEKDKRITRLTADSVTVADQLKQRCLKLGTEIKAWQQHSDQAVEQIRLLSLRVQKLRTQRAKWRNVAKAIEVEFGGLKTRMENIEDAERQRTEETASFERERIDLHKQIQVLGDAKTNLSSQVETLKTTIRKLDRDIGVHEDAYSQLNQNYHKLVSDHDALKESYNAATKAIHELQQNRYNLESSLQAKADELRRVGEFYNAQMIAFQNEHDQKIRRLRTDLRHSKEADKDEDDEGETDHETTLTDTEEGGADTTHDATEDEDVHSKQGVSIHPTTLLYSGLGNHH